MTDMLIHHSGVESVAAAPTRRQAPLDHFALQAFIEVIDQAPVLDLDGLLHLVGARICAVTGIARCSIYLADDQGRFHGRVAHSPHRDIDGEIKRLVAGVANDRFTRQIVQSKSPVLVTNASHDSRTIRTTMRRYRVRDMLGVPLLHREDVIGLIFLDNEEEPFDYGDSTIQIARTFAGLAALAIHQAALVEQVEERAAMVERQRDTLKKLSTIHEALMRSVLSGADPETVIGTIASIVRKPVVLYGADFAVNSWSSGPKGSRPPHLHGEMLSLPPVQRAIDRLLRGEPSVVIPAIPHAGVTNRRLLCRLVAEETTAGYLEIVEVGRPIVDGDVRIAEQSAMVLSLEQLATRRQETTRRIAVEDLLTNLLNGHLDSGVIESRAPLLGIDLQHAHVLLRLAQEPGVEASRRRRELLGNILHSTLGVAVRASIGVPGADIFLLDESIAGSSKNPLTFTTLLESCLAENATRLGIRRAAVSSVCRHPDDYVIAHRDLRLAVELADNGRSDAPIVYQTDVGFIRLFASSAHRDEAIEFAERVLGRLDGPESDELSTTLRTFLAADGKIRRTAEMLNVHENTIRNRLQRIRERTGFDHDSTRDLVELALAVRIQEVLTPAMRTRERSPENGAFDC